MRILTYNIHGCVGTDRVHSLERVGEVIAELGPDVVALQEVDRGRARSKNLDQAELLAERLGMEFHFHPALTIGSEEYGNAILSRHPLRLHRVQLLPTVKSGFFLETRSALWVEIDVNGIPWQVINTHFGLGRGERLLQMTALLGWVGEVIERAPLVVCGDFNSHAGGRVHRLLSGVLRDVQKIGRRNTFPSRLPMLCLDHIFVGKNVRIIDVDVARSLRLQAASDHLPLLAELEMV
ncbi:MAG: endonuclease [Chthoniobacteraceae bacterium]|nr:endonuclease [Chthoniobacteraceae bacterium]